jgi:UDP-N-acetyl-D-glucosamine dehydrogenase
MTDSFERIVAGDAAVGVMGLGYVGLVEALEFAQVGFRVTGFDIDAGRLASLAEGRSYLLDVEDAELRAALRAGRFRPSGNFDELAAMDAILICVPTPLSKTKSPDISYIVSAVESVRTRLSRGQLIVLESTTYPGTTTEVVRPMLEETGLGVGRDVHLCFSPERINPGDKKYPPSKIPRVVGGVTPECARAARELYGWVAPEVVVVSSPEAAEMVKLLENTFRSVNIGLVNELAGMCRTLGVDVWEIIQAAATKPFGFMPFYPGPGLGGHCIPIDPLYLSWKARIHGFEPRFIDLASQVNAAMPAVVVSIVIDCLNARRRSVNGATVLVLGVSYKRDVNDARESPAIDVITRLAARGATVRYHDPHVPTLRVGDAELASVPLDAATLAAADCALVLTDHTAVDYDWVARHAAAVVDTRNAVPRTRAYAEKVVRL